MPLPLALIAATLGLALFRLMSPAVASSVTGPALAMASEAVAVVAPAVPPPRPTTATVADTLPVAKPWSLTTCVPPLPTSALSVDTCVASATPVVPAAVPRAQEQAAGGDVVGRGPWRW